ncbi:hypothetical protein AKO1_013479 [Acrasis kona]|uniref:Ubiquitin-like domain-containing protein n=1 Tax=Acrasis kona TaxID=1008807 RepID=A0AAW2ZK39_9EUKA
MDSNQDTTEQQINLDFRFSNGHTIKTLLTLNTTITQVKQILLKLCMQSNDAQIRSECQEKPFLRLIYQGKSMQDPMFLSFYNVSDCDFIHCAFSKTCPQQRKKALQSSRQNRGNGAPASRRADETDGYESDEQPPVRGFDRLRESGFNEEEVLFFRNQFYASRQNLLQQFQQGSITGDDLRELEEEWMNEDDPNSGNQHLDPSATDNNTQANLDAQTYLEGNNYHMYAGILLGFFLGFVMLLLLLEKLVPRRFKYGVLAGISCNICFALIKFFMPDS